MDQLDEAFNIAMNLYTSSNEVKYLVSQKGRLKNIENLFQQGTVSLKDINIEKSKIRLALISFIQELEEEREINDRMEKEISKFENINSSITIQSHTGTGHNIGRDYISGDQINTKNDNSKK